MAKKTRIIKGKGRRLWVRKDAYDAIERHASQRGQTVEQWVEEAAKDQMETLKMGGFEMKTVKVEVEVPECVVKFLKQVSAFAGDQIDIQKYFRDCVVGGLIGDLDATDGALWDVEALKKKYGLEKLKAKEDC